MVIWNFFFISDCRMHFLSMTNSSQDSKHVILYSWKEPKLIKLRMFLPTVHILKMFSVCEYPLLELVYTRGTREILVIWLEEEMDKIKPDSRVTNRYTFNLTVNLSIVCKWFISFYQYYNEAHKKASINFYKTWHVRLYSTESYCFWDRLAQK